MRKACISKGQLVQLALYAAANRDLFPDSMPRELFVKRVKEAVGAELVPNAVTPTAKMVGVTLENKIGKPPTWPQEFYRTIRERSEKTATRCDELERHAAMLRDIVDKLIHRVIALETKLSEILS